MNLLQWLFDAQLDSGSNRPLPVRGEALNTSWGTLYSLSGLYTLRTAAYLPVSTSAWGTSHAEGLQGAFSHG